MSEMLSQAEMDALMSGLGDDTSAGASQGSDDPVTNEQKDVLGEIGNISMGMAATTLYTILGDTRVSITTPKVKVIDWKNLRASYDRPCVGIRVDYKAGLVGSNILILKDTDVKIIADLMMGGDGSVEEPVELNDIDMSAIGEAMNQMVGSSSTSLSTMIKEKVDIDTPQPFMLDFQDDSYLDNIGYEPDDLIACVAFRMEIGNLIDSEIMQVLPVDFAKHMVDKLHNDLMDGGGSAPAASVSAPQVVPPSSQPVVGVAPQPQAQGAIPMEQYSQAPVSQQPVQYVQQPVQYAQTPMQPLPSHVQTAQFQPLDIGSVMQQKANMDIIMDVPLEVVVELGRAKKSIQEILEFTPGTVVPLDTMAGDPINVLVNGKYVAKGEVVVVEDSFCIRITNVESTEKRI